MCEKLHLELTAGFKMKDKVTERKDLHNTATKFMIVSTNKIKVS